MVSSMTVCIWWNECPASLFCFKMVGGGSGRNWLGAALCTSWEAPKFQDEGWMQFVLLWNNVNSNKVHKTLRHPLLLRGYAISLYSLQVCLLLKLSLTFYSILLYQLNKSCFCISPFISPCLVFNDSSSETRADLAELPMLPLAVSSSPVAFSHPWMIGTPRSCRRLATSHSRT
jgi:hypothetical protein